MQEKYDPKKIEAKWQKKWQEIGIYKTKDLVEKPKFYALDMFPYPSGAGLHVGHPKGYIATDAVSRQKMLAGYNVLHPMGWDAFGLPTENYAIKNKIHPRVATEKNIVTFKKQLEKFGFTYDWDREINTTDPEFYKWTQWIFLKMFERGLAYQSDEPVNWCPSCKTVLANEDLEGGFCERCGTQVLQKKMRQWVLKMTAYADRLLYDLDRKDLDWEELIKEQQRNWIGRSEGAEVEFPIVIASPATAGRGNHVFSAVFAGLLRRSAPRNDSSQIKIYTTRLDTIYGCTYCVVAPEHPLLVNYKLQITNYKEVEKYIIAAQNKTEIERTALVKEKTGVELKGIKAINPFTNEEIPVWVADYVLGFYGTGAVMAVPAHDTRDYEFTKKYKLEIKKVIIPDDIEQNQKSKIKNQNDKSKVKNDLNEIAFIDDGVLIGSGKFTGLKSIKAREEMAKWLEEKKIGKRKINYKMRDWVFSRQRYWGEPFPLIFCAHCKKKAENEKLKMKNEKLKKEFSLGEILNPGWIAVSEKDLPVKLPDVKSYEPAGTGESPLANIKEWVNVKCPKCGGAGRRETNTMPQWAGSSWYYLRYIDPKNKKVPVDKEKEKYWMPVDLYVGGAEHATRHLLYARFWHKFLYDIGVVSAKEPFKKLFHVGLILAEDGRKMSKRWGNVINPDDVIAKYGADSLRLYEMFMGPFSQSVSWNAKGVVGMRRFLERIWGLSRKSKVESQKSNDNKLERLVHQTIKKVTEDIENFKFNTAISVLMVLSNEFEKQEKIEKDYYSNFLIILSPFAPHITEELWSELGNRESIFLSHWPDYNKDLIKEEEIEMLVQINGKLRDRIKTARDISEDEAKKLALASDKIKKIIDSGTIKKVIFIKGRLINLVIKL